MSNLAQLAAGLAAAVVGAWAIPAVAMRALAPTLAASAQVVPNYRGQRVFLGLGNVWLFWAAGRAISTLVLNGPDRVGGWVLPLETPIVLVVLCYAFGMIDDVFGSAEDRGLRGHLRALRLGRLTTGGLKLGGIGAVSVWAAATVALARSGPDRWSHLESFVVVVAGAAVVAGLANLLNLLDLRPGRALKGYIGVFAVALLAWLTTLPWGTGPTVAALGVATVVVWFLGPILAVWSYDLGERGMLGDAGANAAGALVGLMLLEVLPLVGIVVVALIVLALNLSSERVSFSQVIAGNRGLSWLDELGRLPRDGRSGSQASRDSARGESEIDG